jgi:hypothetical protein
MPLAVQNPGMERCRPWQRTAEWLTARPVLSPTSLPSWHWQSYSPELALCCARNGQRPAAPHLQLLRSRVWALTTISTIGYRDRYPVPAEGRVIGGALMIVGIGVMGMVTSALAYRFITTSEDPDAPSLDVRLKQLEARLDEMTVLLRRQND